MGKKLNKVLASSTVACLVVTSTAIPAFAKTTDALAGESRINTAVKIAEASWNNAWKGEKTAVLTSANDKNMADALAVAPLAFKEKAPILLTDNGDKVSTETLALLKKQGVTKVYVTAGAGVLTDKMVEELKANGIKEVVRLGGANRYETAKNIAAKLDGVKEVAVINGEVGLADALSIASVAAAKNIAIAFAGNKDAEPTTIDLAGKTVYAIGGNGVLSDELVKKLSATRLGGDNRYETNAVVLDGMKGNLDFAKVYTADGETLIDALAGSVLAAQTNSPIVLVDTYNKKVNEKQNNVIAANKKADTTVTAFGGAISALTNDVDGAKASTGDFKVEGIKSVAAVANNKVEVKFTSAVTGATNAASYKVVEKGTDKVVEVKAAVAESDKVVVLETAALTAGKAYTLTVDGKSVNFTGIAKVTSAPAVKEVKSVDTERVKVTFDKAVDKETAETVSNYKLNNGATVKSVVISSDRMSVTLTTEGVANNKLYELKVENVKNTDGVALKTASKSFQGTTDTTAPKVNGNAVVITNQKVRITFNDQHGVSKESLETSANYSIKGSDDSVLEVKTAKAVYNSGKGYYDAVELTTSAQKPATKYTVTMSNITDASVSANKITKELTSTFYGRNEDKAGPTIDVANRPRAIEYNIVQLTFTDASALDFASAKNADNYAFDKDVTIEKIEVLDESNPYDKDGKTVRIWTQGMEKGKAYSLTVKGVQDEFGNELKPVSGDKYLPYSIIHSFGNVTAGPNISKVSSLDENTFDITFARPVEKATAEDPTNYEVNGSIGKAVKATLKDEYTVRVKTNSQVANKGYEVTVNGVKDLLGNSVVNAKASFVATRTDNDITAPKALYAQAISESEVRVYFDEALDKTSVSGASFKAGAIALGFADLVDGGKTVVLKTNDALTAGNEYALSITNAIKDKSANELVSLPTGNDAVKFVASYEKNDAPTAQGYEQTTINKIKVKFSEKLSATPAPMNVSGVTFTSTINTDDATILELTAGSKIDTSKELTFNFSGVKDLFGKGSTDTEYKISPYYVDDEKPMITSVEAVDVNTVKVTYSEDVKNAGSYRITYKDDNNNDVPVAANPVDVDGNVVTLSLASKLSSDKNYTLKPTSGATDMANLVEDIKDVVRDFSGTDVQPTDKYISGVTLLNANTIKVSLANTTSTTNAAIVEEMDGSKVVATTTGAVTWNADNNQTNSINLSDFVLLSGKTYKVTVDGMSYTFKGIALTGDVAVSMVGTNYEVGYYDSKAGDTVSVYKLDTDNKLQIIDATQVIAADANKATIARGANDENTDLYVVVRRGSTIIGATKIKATK